MSNKTSSNAEIKESIEIRMECLEHNVDKLSEKHDALSEQVQILKNNMREVESKDCMYRESNYKVEIKILW